MSKLMGCRSSRCVGSDRSVAQFDVLRLTSSDGLVVDCQSDLLADLNTRFVAPLLPRSVAPSPASRLNPPFSIGGDEYVLATQFAASVQCRELGEIVASLREQALTVVTALDVLISGV